VPKFVLQMVEKLKLEQLGRIDLETFKQTKKIPLVVVLDNIRSMNNVGSIFRTSDAFMIEKIILCGITPKPPHREIHKSALGATDSVSWQYEENILDSINALKAKNYRIFAVEQTSKSENLHEINISKNEKYALIFGNEVDGVSDDVLHICDNFIEIPQFGTKHSLNVSICFGIVVWDFFKKIKF